MNTTSNALNASSVLQVNHWLAQSLGLLLVLVFGPATIIMFNTGKYFHAIGAILLAALGILGFILYGRTEMSEEVIMHKSLYGRFRIKWDEVQEINTDRMGNTILFKGKGKQLAIPGTSFWSGKDKKRMMELYSRQVKMREIPVKYTQAAIYAISRGTR